ncbi:MAG: hypothetical protein ABWX74_21015 [Aeromicrobium sp.]
MSDPLQAAVNDAVTACLAGPSRSVLKALAPLSQIDPEDLLPELFLQVEEASDGVDLSRVTGTDLMPDPGVTRSVVDAVRAKDFDQLKLSVSGDYADLMTTLVATIAAMRSAPRA